MKLTKIVLHTALLGRVLPAIACFGILPLHAKNPEEVKFSKIITSEFYKNIKVPTLVKVNHGQSRMSEAQANIARKEASRVYKILMKDEIPDLKIHDQRSRALYGESKDGLYAFFDHDDDNNLMYIHIYSSNPETKFSARSEVKHSPSKTFQEIFGQPAVGKLKRSNSRHITDGIVGGSASWRISWPEKVEYKGSFESSSLRWRESKGKIRGWTVSKSMKADLTKTVKDLSQKKPDKINMDQAIAAAYKSVLSLGLPVATRRLPSTKLCYYNLPYLSLDRKRWRNKNKPNIDGLSAMFGIYVSFDIPDSFSSVDVMVDHQTGEVLYVATWYE